MTQPMVCQPHDYSLEPVSVPYTFTRPELGTVGSDSERRKLLNFLLRIDNKNAIFLIKIRNLRNFFLKVFFAKVNFNLYSSVLNQVIDKLNLFTIKYFVKK